LPLYAYRCTKCGHKFEKIQNFSAEPEHECPKCHGLLERPLTAPRLNFKGAGWYVNDYASKSSAPASETASADASDSGKAVPSGTASTETKAPTASSESTASAPASTPAPSSPSGSTTSGSTS
jgi:putative FmdB family regulatory protein